MIAPSHYVDRRLPTVTNMLTPNPFTHDRRQYYLGGNPDKIVLNSSMPRHWSRPIHHRIKTHFDSMEMQAMIRKHVPREFISAADIQSALDANNPHSRNYSADFAMMYIALQGGLRSGTVSLLRLQDIIEIDINLQTLRIRVSCNMYRFKARGEGWARIKNFSGYINQPNNPIYHLHHRILELTNGAMGLIRCNSIEESMYTYKYDPASVGIVAEDVRAEPRNYTTIINYLHEQDDQDLKETYLFTRGSLTSPTSRHAQMVRKRFAHYPPQLLKRLVFHSLRAGFYVTTVFNIAKHNAWNVGQALDVAKLLGEWRIHTDPSVWYGGGKRMREQV